jgi:hypothetical protein
VPSTGQTNDAGCSPGKAWLRILDALTGADPETPADEKRERDREQIERAFPKNEP